MHLVRSECMMMFIPLMLCFLQSEHLVQNGVKRLRLNLSRVTQWPACRHERTREMTTETLCGNQMTRSKTETDESLGSEASDCGQVWAGSEAQGNHASCDLVYFGQQHSKCFVLG